MILFLNIVSLFSDSPIVTPQVKVIANISTNANLSCAVEANPPPIEIRWDKIDGGGISFIGPNFVFYAEKRHAGNYSCTAKSRLEPSDGLTEEVASRGYSQVIVQCK